MNEMNHRPRTETALATVERPASDLALAPISDAQGAKARLQELQAFVWSVMVEGHDYGTIPGTDKPTLYKAGAEKLLEIYGLAATVEITHRIEEWERGFWGYEARCTIRSRRTGDVIGEGVGSCNSMEARYRWRVEWSNNDAGRPPEGEGWKRVSTKRGSAWKRRVENEDRWDLPNTILKMSKKRSLVDATLAVTRSSGLFTQDLEDLMSREDDEVVTPDAVIRPASQPASPKPTVKSISASAAPIGSERAASLTGLLYDLLRSVGRDKTQTADWIEAALQGVGAEDLASCTEAQGKVILKAAEALAIIQ